MSKRMFFFISAIIVLCGFFFIAPLLGKIFISDENSTSYTRFWDENKNFIFTGGTTSSLSGSENFFTNEKNIDSIKTFLSKDGEIKYYVEYPNFTEIQNFFILSNLQRFIKFDFAKSLSGNISDYGIDAHFFLDNQENIGSVRYKINALSFSGNIFHSEEKTFFVTENGDVLEPKNLISPKNTNTTLALAKILQKNYKENFLKNNEIISENISERFHNYLENPEFFFSGSTVQFSIPSNIFSQTQSEKITLSVPYSDIENIIKKNIEPPTNNTATIPTHTTRDKKYVALTFDDGPHKTLTPKLLEILREKGVKATFFVLGQNAERLPDVLKQTHDEGHEIGSHSWDHASFLKLSNPAIHSQISRTQGVIKNTIGIEPILFRPPYGAYNKNTIKNVGMSFVMWSVDSYDWKNRNVAKNLKTTLSTVHDGAIILFHDIHATSIDTIPELIDSLRNQGYEFLTVSELYQKFYNRSLLPEQVCFSMSRCGAK